MTYAPVQGRSALEDLAHGQPDSMTRAAGLALLAPRARRSGGRVGGAAAARRAPLPARGALGDAAARRGASAAAEGVRHHIDATTRVRVAVDAHGHAVRGHRHAAARRLAAGRLLLHDRRAADRRRALLRLAVDAGAAHRDDHLGRVQPGQARARSARDARSGAVAGSLPLRVSIGGGKVTLTNATGITTTAFAADALKPQLEMFLAGLRRATRTGSPPTGGGALVTSQPVQTTVRVIAPLRVTGTIGSRHVDVTARRRRRSASRRGACASRSRCCIRRRIRRRGSPGASCSTSPSGRRSSPHARASTTRSSATPIRAGRAPRPSATSRRPGRAPVVSAVPAQSGRDTLGAPALGLRRPGRARRRRARLV